MSVSWPLGLSNDPLGTIVLVTASDETPGTLINVLRIVADALSLYMAGADLALDRPGQPTSQAQGANGTMTPRHREVLTLMASGLTLSQIARRIGFSELSH